MIDAIADGCAARDVFGRLSRVGQSAARLGRSLCSALLMRRLREALGGLPADMLSGIGLTHADMADMLRDAPCDHDERGC
jgi:hypothetical protein